MVNYPPPAKSRVNIVFKSGANAPRLQLSPHCLTTTTQFPTSSLATPLLLKVWPLENCFFCMLPFTTTCQICEFVILPSWSWDLISPHSMFAPSSQFSNLQRRKKPILRTQTPIYNPQWVTTSGIHFIHFRCMGSQFSLDSFTPTSLLLWDQCKNTENYPRAEQTRHSHECHRKEEGPKNNAGF